MRRPDADRRGFERVLTEWDSELFGVGVHLRTITRDGWVCSTYQPGFSHDGTEGELYDLADDPLQQVNRWDDPALASLRSDLLADLWDHQPPMHVAAAQGRGTGLIAATGQGFGSGGCERSRRRPWTVISSSLYHGAGLSPLRCPHTSDRSLASCRQLATASRSQPRRRGDDRIVDRRPGIVAFQHDPEQLHHLPSFGLLSFGCLSRRVVRPASLGWPSTGIELSTHSPRSPEPEVVPPKRGELEAPTLPVIMASCADDVVRRARHRRAVSPESRSDMSWPTTATSVWSRWSRPSPTTRPAARSPRSWRATAAARSAC